jgi:hypothetical protein
VPTAIDPSYNEGCFDPQRGGVQVSTSGAPQIAGHVGKGAAAPSPAYVSDFLAHADGLKLVRAFTEISNAKLRRSLVRLVEQIVGEDGR